MNSCLCADCTKNGSQTQELQPTFCWINSHLHFCSLCSFFFFSFSRIKYLFMLYANPNPNAIATVILTLTTDYGEYILSLTVVVLKILNAFFVCKIRFESKFNIIANNAIPMSWSWSQVRKNESKGKKNFRTKKKSFHSSHLRLD